MWGYNNRKRRDIKERVPGTESGLFDSMNGLLSRIKRAVDDSEGLFLDPEGLFPVMLRLSAANVVRKWCCAAAITGLIVCITLWHGPKEGNYMSDNAVRPNLEKKMAMTKNGKCFFLVKMLMEINSGIKED